MYRIRWQPKARRRFGKIRDRRRQEEILAAILGLQGFPAAPGVRRLVNHRFGYRLRVGRFRVLFDVHETIQIIDIQEINKRDERTY